MRKTFALTIITIMLAGLLMVPLGGNVSENFVPISDNEPFVISADGDVSTDSITSFSETLADDVLFYPDQFTDPTKQSTAASGGPSTAGTHTNTHVDDATCYLAWDSTSPYYTYAILTISSSDYAISEIEGIYVKLDVLARSGDASQMLDYNISLYNYDTTSYDILGSGNGAGYEYITTYDEDYFSDVVMIKVESSDTAGDYPKLWWDYAHVDFYIMTLADSDHYAESFADVSDWSVTSGNAPTTDNDVMSWVIPNDGNYDTIYTDVSASYENNYVEFRYKTNTVTAVIVLGIKLYSGDAGAGTCIKQNYFTAYTTWTTTKYIIPSDTVVESILFVAKSTTDALTIQCDNLRIGESDEMGWQHDGSTTEGVTDDSSASWTYSASSDNDILTLFYERTGTGSDHWGNQYIAWDTTATVSDIERDYYPFFGIRYRVTERNGIGSQYPYASPQTDGFRDVNNGISCDSASWTTEYLNMKAMTTATGNQYVDMWVYATTEGYNLTIEIEWLKAFSIANFMVSRSGSPDWTTSDYLYVDNGDVVSVAPTVGWMRLDYDPTLSVATATHNVWNATLSSGASDFRFREYVDSTWTFFDQGETRGELSSGTLTDLSLYFYGACTLSAIKFWTDGTAPTMSDKWVNPPEPYDDEDTTITVATTDGVDIYTVTLNAGTYPTGFSDVDYEMTETVDNELYKHTFSSMTAGYYEFAITVDDGANTYTEYVPMTVRESEIDVDPISFFGVGEDFNTMTFSFEINKACSYVINEASENVGASDTHSGSVSEGMQNVAWAKLTTDDALVNFTITFTNASLTYVIDGQYQVAQTALSVSSYDWGVSETNIAISFQTSKGGTYTVYLDDVQDSTSSFVTGSNFLTWIRPHSTDPAEIDAGVKLTDGTTTIWLNQTYSEFSDTVFSIGTLIIDKSGPDITAFATTTWLNGTLYLYQNDAQQDTGAEGTTLSYAKSAAAGTYNVALKIDCGGEIAWWNDTYTIAAATLDITPISFFGVGEDFTQMSVSFECSLSGSWSIVEWVQADGSDAAETHTGSVTVGWNNIAWTKLDTTSDIVYFNMTVTSGALSETIPGLYGVAQLVLVITARPLSLANDEIIFSGQANKIGTWTLYLDDVQESTDSFLDSSFVINWTRAQSVALEKVAFALKFVNSTDTIWINGTYDKYSLVALTLATFDLDWFQNNITSLHLTTSWGNATIDVRLNGSLVINDHAEGLFNFTRSSNEGYFNVTIVIDGGADTITYKAWVYFTTEGVTYEGDTTYNSAYSSTQNVYEGPITVVDPDTVIIEGDVSFDDDKEEELAEAQWNTLRLIIEVISFPIIMAIAFFMGKARRQAKPRDRTSDVFRDVG